MFYRKALTVEWIDRGDIDAVDYTKDTLTADGDWHDLDMSSIVGATERLVLLSSFLKDNAGDKEMLMRTKGNVNEINIAVCGTIKADKTCRRNMFLYTNVSGVVQYKIESGVWANIDLIIRGWYK